MAGARPVAVYLGRHLVANGVNLHVAIGRVGAQVPFAIKTPRFVPAEYRPVQLAVTPRQPGVSGGLSTLTYVVTRQGRASPASSNGFQINQASRAIPFVGGVRARTVARGRFRATVREFKAPGADIVVLTWMDTRGHGFSIITPEGWSHLSTNTLLRIAASLS